MTNEVFRMNALLSVSIQRSMFLDMVHGHSGLVLLLSASYSETGENTLTCPSVQGFPLLSPSGAL